jgi:hypothetical protein
MLVCTAFIDAVLGCVTWNAQDKAWEFDAGPIDGRSVPARLISNASQLVQANQDWDQVRACVCWVRANEPTVRAFIRDKVHNPETLPLWLMLTGINFYNEREAQLVYNDVGCFVVVIVQVNGKGEIVGSKVLVSG